MSENEKKSSGDDDDARATAFKPNLTGSTPAGLQSCSNSDSDDDDFFADFQRIKAGFAPLEAGPSGSATAFAVGSNESEEDDDDFTEFMQKRIQLLRMRLAAENAVNKVDLDIVWKERIAGGCSQVVLHRKRGITLEEFDRFFNLLPGSQVNQLSMTQSIDDDIAGECCKSLAKVLPSANNLRELALSGCQISSDGMKFLAQSLPLSNLTQMYLNGCGIGDEGLSALIAAGLGKLKSLSLVDNELTPTSSSAFLISLHENTTLTTLYLSDNCLRGCDVSLLIRKNVSLTCLAIDRCELGHKQVVAILQELRNNSALGEISLDYNYESGTCLQELCQCLLSNANVHCLSIYSKADVIKDSNFVKSGIRGAALRSACNFRVLCDGEATTAQFMFSRVTLLRNLWKELKWAYREVLLVYRSLNHSLPSVCVAAIAFFAGKDIVAGHKAGWADEELEKLSLVILNRSKEETIAVCRQRALSSIILRRIEALAKEHGVWPS